MLYFSERLLVSDDDLLAERLLVPDDELLLE